MVDSPDSSFELVSNSDHSDADESNAVEKERTSKKEKPQKIQEKKQVTPFQIAVLFALCIMATILIPRLGVKKITERVDKNIEMQTNEIFKRQEELFGSQIFGKGRETLVHRGINEKLLIDQASKIVEGKKSLNEKKLLIQVPKNLMDKWIPDPSRFQGVQEFLQKITTPASEIEELFYLSTPNITFDRMWELKWNKDMKPLETLKLDDCKYYTSCHKTRMYIKKGDLYIHETLTSEKQKVEFTRVFYISVLEFI